MNNILNDLKRLAVPVVILFLAGVYFGWIGPGPSTPKVARHKDDPKKKA